MKNFKNQILRLEHNLIECKQLTIDLVQNASIELFNDHDEPKDRDSIGAYSYQVGVTLEIFNPVFSKDFNKLEALKSILDEMVEAVTPRQENANYRFDSTQNSKYGAGPYNRLV